MGDVRRAGPLGRVAGPHRQADPQRRQHRHRRLGPRAGDGLRGAAPLLRPRADVPVRLERRLDRLRRGHARPRPRRDAVHRLLEDVHDARDDDQRPLGARVAAAGAGRRGGDRQALRRRLHERRRACASSGSTPPTCSGSGTGSGAATRWTRRSGSRRCSRSARSASREMLAGLPRDGRALPHDAAASEPAGADGPAGGLVRRLLRRADRAG